MTKEESKALEAKINELAERYPEVSFAKLSRIAKAAYDFGRQVKPETQELDEALELVNEYNLKPYRDGNAWCILLGKDIQSGICGFGNTLTEAYLDFLRAYKEYNHPIGELLAELQHAKGLDEAAEENAIKACGVLKVDIAPYMRGFKAGAKWDAEQMPKIKGWVAREDAFNGCGLILHRSKPWREGIVWSHQTIAMHLPWSMFPDLKWEDEPIEVELAISRVSK